MKKSDAVKIVKEMSNLQREAIAKIIKNAPHKEVYSGRDGLGGPYMELDVQTTLDELSDSIRKMTL